MSYNHFLFQQMFDEANQIIENSDDKSIRRKKKKLEIAYKKVQQSDSSDVQEFYSLLHEIRTYELLKKLNLKPVSHNDNSAGPDYISDIGYVECVTFTKPTDDDSKKILKGSFNRYKAYEPRVSQAIQEKYYKYKKYFEEDEIDKTCPRIVCVNAGQCEFDIHGETFIEAFEKILYGLGCESVEIDASMKTEHWFRKYEDSMTKPNGALIETDLFSKKPFSIISAVMYVDNLVYEKYNRPIIYINHNAKVKIDRRKIRKFLSFIRVGKLKYNYYRNGKITSHRKYCIENI